MTPLLGFSDIFVASPKMDEVIVELQKLPNIELDLVKSEFDLVSLSSAEDIEEFRDFLKNRTMKLPGLKSTETSIVLHAHTETKVNGKSETISPRR